VRLGWGEMFPFFIGPIAASLVAFFFPLEPGVGGEDALYFIRRRAAPFPCTARARGGCPPLPSVPGRPLFFFAAKKNAVFLGGLGLDFFSKIRPPPPPPGNGWLPSRPGPSLPPFSTLVGERFFLFFSPSARRRGVPVFLSGDPGGRKRGSFPNFSARRRPQSRPSLFTFRGRRGPES